MGTELMPSRIGAATVGVVGVRRPKNSGWGRPTTTKFWSIL